MKSSARIGKLSMHTLLEGHFHKIKMLKKSKGYKSEMALLGKFGKFQEYKKAPWLKRGVVTVKKRGVRHAKVYDHIYQ